MKYFKKLVLSLLFVLSAILVFSSTAYAYSGSYTYTEESTLSRVDLFNTNKLDGSDRNSFTYELPSLIINQNKMLNLYQFIDSIDVQFKLYNNNKIDFEVFTCNIYNNLEEYDYLKVFENIKPQYEFVTFETIGFNGIEDIKLTVLINFNIGGDEFSIPYVFDEFINVNEDY